MNHAQFYTALFKFTIIICFVLCLSGCVGAHIILSSHVYEEMKINNVLLGTNEAIALDVTSTYYRYGITNEVWYDFKEAFAEHGKEPKEPDKVLLRQYKPRMRYVLLDSSFFDWQIKDTTSTTNQTFPIKYIGITHAKIIPNGFLAPSATSILLPTQFASTVAVKYRPNEPIPIKYKGKTIYISFDNVEFEPEARMKTRYWMWPLAIPCSVVDAGIIIPGTIVIMTSWVILSPIILIAGISGHPVN